MTVPSFQFIAVALLVALLVNVSQDRRWRSGVMLVANLAFLASFAHTPLALVPFAGFVAAGFLGQRWAQARAGASRVLLPALIITALAVFFWLKRYTFIPSGLFLPTAYVTVGLSYVFFRVLHLIIDAGQGALAERIGVVDYVNYTLNFTSLVAGPIQTFPDWREGHEGRPGLATIAQGVERMLIGTFKVIVVSALLDALQIQTRSDLLSDGGVLRGAAVIALYPIYLFFNFSGYVDVVVGASSLMGLRLPENFNRPFTAANFIDFWARWHITLSTWLRTYVYTPLMMTLMRRLPAPGLIPALTVLSFFVTFFLVGAWHGQTSEFLFFGVLQGGGVAMNKLYQLVMAGRLGAKGYRKLGENPLYRAVCRGLTFTWFAFTLLWFWSDWKTLGHLAGALGGPGVVLALAAIWAVATVALEILTSVQRLLSPAYRPEVRALAAGAMIYLIVVYTMILSAPPPPVVYKAF